MDGLHSHSIVLQDWYKAHVGTNDRSINTQMCQTKMRAGKRTSPAALWNKWLAAIAKMLCDSIKWLKYLCNWVNRFHLKFHLLWILLTAFVFHSYQTTWDLTLHWAKAYLEPLEKPSWQCLSLHLKEDACTGVCFCIFCFCAGFSLNSAAMIFSI